MSNIRSNTIPVYPPIRQYIKKARINLHGGYWHSEKETQDKVAAACGLSRVAYGNIESGKQNMTLLSGIKIAQYLKIDFNEFCKEELIHLESKEKFAKMIGQRKK